MDEWLWWLKLCCAAGTFLGMFFAGLAWVFHWAFKKLDERNKTIIIDVFKDLSVSLMDYFNAQLTERDTRISIIKKTQDRHELVLAQFQETLTWHGERLTDLAIAGTTVATIALYPTSPASKREKDRAIEEIRKLIIPRIEKIQPKGD